MIKKLLLVLTLYSSVNIGGAIDFNTPPPGRAEHNLNKEVNGPVVIEGYTFTPSSWNAWVTPEEADQDDRPGMYMSPWLGFEHSMTITNGGRFNFTGFDSIALVTLMGQVTSSEGHVFDYQMFRHLAKSYDLNWRDVAWIRFDVFRENEFSLPPVGFDNLEVGHSFYGTPGAEVPEPATLVLFLVVLPFALWMRSRGYK